ncbi:sensor histidine kinase [Massilia glaciei]|uniref:Sensor histidine kinase n=2 Tax=Massilia glaciei TaxID=1524097 RepID=A0A2U2HLC9_9BURK|nr:sensor histidine kinase [Massilia glaciei]
MNPSKRTALVFGLSWLLFWTLMVCVAIQDYLRDHGQHLWQPVLWETSSLLTGTALLLLQRHFTRSHDALLATPWRWFARQALWLPMYWVAFVPLAFGMRHGVYALAGQVYQHEPWLDTFVYESLKISVFVGLLIVIRFGVLSYRELLEEKLRVEQSNSLLRQAQLQRLTQQMQPHFLFNALNTISSLMHSDVERADATLIELADVLRTTLELGELHEAPLATEIRLARAYARVMAERYRDRVAIDWRIDDSALACAVPVISVQPLLENIFKHTVERRSERTNIVISASCRAGSLLVRLDDDSGTLAGDEEPGIGLRNVRARIAFLHGAGATLELSQLLPAGVRAEMRLPCAC